MIEIITNPFYETFMELCTKSQQSIRLCAPYIKSDVVADILASKQDGVPIDMITKVNLRDYHSKVSDLEALRFTLLGGGRVYNCSNLHAKAYIFDDKLCVISSANLTIFGLRRNAECGVLTDNARVVNEVLTFYNGVVNRDDVGRISEQNIEEISDLLSRIPPAPPIVYPRMDLSVPSDENLNAISEGLSGWKRNVFLSLGQFDETFTTTEVSILAQQLGEKYPKNNYREAKVRQVLQQLRDLGLIEFTSPGIYKKLWV